MSDRDDFDSEAPPSEEEIARAERLRSELDSDPLVKALRAAWSPDALDEDAHAAMLDDAPTSAEEMALAEALRKELEDGRGPDVVHALRSAYRPMELRDDEHRAMVTRALGNNVVRLERRRLRAVVATTTILALAASIVLWVSNRELAELPLAHTRSTQPLFDEPFKAGETSARIDRIAMARATDYRDNRFAKWGVR